MGLIYTGAPKDLILKLKYKYGLVNFIESGTYEGNTAVWAASYFDNVITIEYSQKIYNETIKKHGKIKNIKFIFGDSRVVINKIVQDINTPSLFWLDSHWSCGNTYGENDECPLIDEINSILKSPHTHFILIDDARLFLSPPPLPHHPEQWPSIDEVIMKIKSTSHNYYIAILDDVIIAVPQYAKDFIINYCQEINTSKWNEYSKNLNESAIKKGIRLIFKGCKLLISSVFYSLKK